MNNANSSEEQLLELLRQCTVKLAVANGHGTGFFVSAGTILTCAHVVEAAQKGNGAVTAHWNGQSYPASIQRFLSEMHPSLNSGYPDLALLKVDVLANTNHPCVYLHTEAYLDDKMYCYGYTDEYPTGDPSTYINEGWSDEQHLLLKLKEGQARSGLSGAPILNRRTGGICGILKRSRGTTTDLGGRAIPTPVIFKKLLDEKVDLRDLQQNFHALDKRWYNCLTQQQHEIIGMSPHSTSIKVFFLYDDNEEDQKWLIKLEKHLSVLQKQNLITTWHKGKIASGDDEKKAISEHLQSANVILLMVSSDFMDSHYLEGTEVEEALKRRKTGVRVLPVILRASDWKNSSFKNLRPLPLNGKSVSEWANHDQAFLEVTQGIRQVVESLEDV